MKSGIRDNRTRGKVAEFLKEKATSGSRLSVVSAYFTIYAYEALSDQLDGIESLQFLFGEPKFIQTLDPEKTDKKAFKIEDEGLELANRLQQKEVARRCAEWITNKVEIRSIREANLLHGKLYHVDDGRREHALMGSSNFTQRGLGLSSAPNIELNMVVDSDRDRTDLKAWFDELWSDTALVEDVKAKVLEYLAQLYVDHSRSSFTSRPCSTFLKNFSLARRSKPSSLTTPPSRIQKSGKPCLNSRRMVLKGPFKKSTPTTAASWPTAWVWVKPIRR